MKSATVPASRIADQEPHASSLLPITVKFSDPPLGTGIVTSNLPPKHANFFSYDAQAMEESRGSREALYLQGIFVDASVNNLA